MPNIDHVVLFSGDGDFHSLVESVRRRGVRTSLARAPWFTRAYGEPPS